MLTSGIFLSFLALIFLIYQINILGKKALLALRQYGFCNDTMEVRECQFQKDSINENMRPKAFTLLYLYNLLVKKIKFEVR